MADQPKSLQAHLKEKKQETLTNLAEELKKPVDEMTRNAFRIKAMVNMLALGFTKKEIAEQLSIPLSRVNMIFSSESAKKEVQRIQEKFFFVDPQKMFMSKVPRAFREVSKLMEGKKTKEAVKLQAANTIFDRALGKPVQEIKHEGSAIKDLFLALDQRKNAEESKTIEATYHEVKEETKTSEEPFDVWLNENL